MVKVTTIFGTRPDTIKMAPVIQELRKYNQEFKTITIATAQHREMLDQVLNTFRIKVDYDLNIMQPRQSLAHIVINTIGKLDRAFQKLQPDVVLVQGDTSTTFVGSLTAFYHKIPVGHIEAGLRTEDKYNPFPEEMNRRLTSSMAELHFAPTRTAKRALLSEHVPPQKIFITGNTVIDALFATVQKAYQFRNPLLQKVAQETGRSKKRLVLITSHRRENWGEPMRSACRAIKKLANRYRDVNFVFPVHLNPTVREVVFPILKRLDNVFLVEPLDYQSFANLMNYSYLILTDSGGIQEEAPSLGKPVLVLRKVTERPEAVEAGTVTLVGLDEQKIFREASRLLENAAAYKKMASAVNPYGDGKAAWRIVQILRWHFRFRRSKPPEFQS